MRRRRAKGGLAVASLLVTLSVLPAALLPGSAHADSGATPTTVTKTVTRVHLVAGQDVPVDSRDVSLTVSQTTQLRSQRIAVSWTGAHPTGGIVPDQNSPDASNQEYPFVLMECRGDAGSVAPSTCWTQSPSERKVETRDQQNLFPPYRVDRYAAAADRKDVVGQPAGCHDDAPVQHWVPFTGADGTTFTGGGLSGCGTAAPEASVQTTQDRSGNTTYGVTRTDGTGGALFNVWTEQDNASLGCSATVTCSLVAIPVEGISCDVTGAGVPAEDRPSSADPDQTTSATAGCTATGRLRAGSLSSTGNPADVDQAVTGALWWSASNWRNRIVVPLSFAPTSSVCDVVSDLPQADVYGSELMTQATGQWAPALCGNGGTFKLKHIQTGEPQARNLVLSRGIKAAFVTDPPDGGYSSPTVSAPTALTGFAVSYVMDDAAGNPYHSLRLTPRLLAKLMTESYPTLPQVKSGAFYLSPNPLTILKDPEFLALNPALRGVQTDRTPTSGAIILPSSGSDVMSALTSYLLADPEAKAWLDGDADPWGMVVNKNYQIDRANAQLSLPTDNWPLLDSYEPKDYYDAAGGDLNVCLHNNPVPYLPLVAGPVVRLSVVTQDLQLALSTAQTSCQPGVLEPDPTGEKLISPGRQPQGFRFLIGITPIADAQRYLLDTAALETQSSVDPKTAITDDTGRTFVSPTDASLQAAADRATPDETAGVWRISSSTLRSSAPDAYPGTMIVSTVVPTQGLSATDASTYSSLLRFVAGPGQDPGLANGDLARGYVPITAANGLGALHAYTLAAADAIAAQKGDVPSLIPAAAGPLTRSSSPSPSASSSPGRHASPSKAAASPAPSPSSPVRSVPGPAARAGGTTTAPAPVSVPAVATPGASSPDQVATLARTTGRGAGVAGVLLPLVALAGVTGLAVAALSWELFRRRTGS